MNEQVDYRSVIDRLVESGQLRDAAPATPAAPVAPVAPVVPIAPAAPMVPSTPPSGRTVDDYRASIQQLPPETFEAAPSGEPAVRPSGVDLRLTRDALAGQGDLRLGPTVERAQLLGTTRMGPTPENARIASSAAAAQRMLGDVRPDVIADIRRLSRDMGIPVPLAAQTYLDRAQQERRRSYERLLQENPGLRAMAQRGSGYADFLEDARALATVENAYNSLIRAPIVGAGRFLTVSIPQGLADVNEIAARNIAGLLREVLPADVTAAIDAAGEDLIAFQEAVGIPLLPSEILSQPATVLDEIYTAIDVPEDERTFTTDLGAAVGQFGAQAALYLMTGGQAAVLSTFFASVDEQSRRVEAAGATGTLEGDVGTLTAAGVSALLDRLNLGAIFDRFPETMRSRIVRILASGTSEGTTELLQAVSSNVIAQGIYDPDSGTFDEAAYEALLGGIVGAFAGALTPGRSRAGGRGEEGEPPLPEDLERLLSEDGLPTAQQRAEEAAASLETTRAAIEETRTFARDPDAVRELLQEAGDQEVTIPAAEVDRLYQEGTLTDADIEYLQVEEELTQQGELSGDVSVAASRLLTLEGDSFSALVDNVRVSPDALTVAEARDAIANREADIERLQGVLEQAEATVGEVNTLADTIFEQLRATQTLSRGQSRAAARLLAERYAARAALFEEGVTAQSLYERDRVSFERAEAGQTQTLEQPSTPPVETVQPGIDGTYRVTDGRLRAELNVAPREPYASSVQVPQGMQRRGIATALYDAAERDLGRRMFPSPLGLTEDAQRFWIDRLSRIPQAEALALLDEAQASGDARNVGRNTAERLAPIRESVLRRSPDDERLVLYQDARPRGATVRPRMGEAFDDWIDRAYAPENRGPGNTLQDEDVVFRAMSPEEAAAGEAAGVFRDMFGNPLYVANDPERYIGGGAYGGKRQGRIYEFDVTGLDSEVRSGGVGIQERAIQELPVDRVRRVWEWNPETQAHELIVDNTEAAAPDALEQAPVSAGTPEQGAFEQAPLDNDVSVAGGLTEKSKIKTRSLLGARVIPLFADLTDTGSVFDALDGLPIAPTPYLGGPNFPWLQAYRDAGIVWAFNKPGVITVLRNKVSALKAQSLAEGGDGRVVITMLAMKDDAHTSNEMTISALLRTLDAVVEAGRFPPKQLATAQKMITSKAGKKEDGYKELATFPGFGDAQALHDWIRTATFPGRKAVVNEMRSAAFRDLPGMFPVERIVREAIDPEYRATQVGDALLAFEIDPDAPDLLIDFDDPEQAGDVPRHPAYRYGMRGTLVGSFSTHIPMEVLYSDLLAEVVADAAPGANPKFLMERLGGALDQQVEGNKKNAGKSEFKLKIGAMTDARLSVSLQPTSAAKPQALVSGRDYTFRQETNAKGTKSAFVTLNTPLPEGAVLRMTANAQSQLITEDVVRQAETIEGLQDYRIAQAYTAGAAGQWRSSDDAKNKGGIAPIEFVRALVENEAAATLTQYTEDDIKEGKKDGSFRVFQLGIETVQDGGLNVWMGVKTGLDYREEYPGDVTNALVEQGVLTDNEVALVGVANNELGVSGMATFQVLKGIEEGVTVLDAFKVRSASKPDGLLPTIYATLGFEEVAEIPFDPQYFDDQQLADLKAIWTRQGWNEADGYPAVAIMKWRGDDALRADATRRFILEGQAGLGIGGEPDFDQFDATAASVLESDAASDQGDGVAGQGDGRADPRRYADRARGISGRVRQFVDNVIAADDRAIDALKLPRPLIERLKETYGTETTEEQTAAPIAGQAGSATTQEATVLEQPTLEGPQTPTKGAVGAPRGAYRLPTNDDPRNIIELTANSDASTFVHEVGHMFLYQMLRDLQDSRLTADGRARLEADIAATRSWFARNSEQALSDLQKMARDVRKRANADAGNAQLQLRASRLEAAVERAQAGGGSAYMQRVAEAFLDPDAQGYDEAAEVVFHELWARGFEKYLGSGSAPSAALRSVFARFAKYITSVYKSLRRLNVNVSPEVADVFDRLVATEEAIRQERRGATYQLSPGVLDGATPAEARELRRLAAEAEEEATTQMVRREENALKRQERDRRAARREVLTNEITEQVSLEPAYAAMSIAATGRLPDGTETGTGKISRAEVEFVADAATADRIPRRVISGRTAPANAIPLADLALLSGFPDIDSLVTALSDPNMRSLQDEVAARVDAQMQAEFGAETAPDALRDQAIEAVQNTKFQQLQQLQLRILRRLAAEPLARVSRRQAEQVGAPPAAADTAAERAAEAEQAAARTPREGVQSALARIRANVQRQANVPQRRAQAAATRQTRTIQRNIDPAAIAEAASRYVATMEVGKATPARYRQAAQRLTVKIERAIAARNYSEASSLMEQRALNLAVAQEAAQVQTKVEAQRKRWRQVLARPDKRLATSYDMNWVNAIRVLLEPIGFARVNDRNFKAEDALAELQTVEPALYADIISQISAAGRDAQLAAQADPKQPHRALTVTRMMEIFELANQLLANARNTHGLLVAGRRIEFGKIAAEAAAYIDNRREVQRRAAKPQARPSRFREAWADMTAGFRATLRRVEILARDLDNGDPRGPVTRYLVRPVMAAVDAYSDARLEPLQRLGDLLKDRGDLLKAKEIKADELAPGWSFRNKGELLMAVLNSGNESNLRKLLMGGGRVGDQWSAWTSTQTSAEELDTSQWDAFLDRMFAEGVLTKDDMDAVQGIWDIFEDTKKGAQAAHQRMFGYRFVEVEASPVQTPVGTYRGGYVPAVLDRLMNPGADKYEVQEVMSQQANASMFPGAEKGFTQARTDATYVIDLDITRLPMHFDRVMKFTHLGPAVQQAARLVNNAEFAAQIARVNPRLTRDALIPWLKRTVQQQVAAPSTAPGLRLLSRGAEVLDRRVGMHIMAANLKNAAEQMTGFFPALARIPAKHLLAAGTTWRLDGESARRHMLEVSPFMRQRIQIGANETLNLIDNIMREPGLLSRAQDAAVRYSYFAQQLVSSAMEPTIWLAAERQAMETIYPAAYADALSRTGDDAEADRLAKAEVYAYADEVVRTTQGSTRPSDVSGIEGTTALMRIFLRFYSFFNAQGNSFVAERNIALNSDMGWAGRNGRAFYAYAMILAVPAILSRILGTALQGGYDDLDEEEATQLAFEALIGSQVEMAAGTIPFLGQAASIPYGVLFTDSPFDDGIRGSAGLSVASRAGVDVVRLIADIADPETDVETVQAARTTLNATGLLLGLPTNWLSKPLAYAERVQEGEADPEGLVDIVQGILTGRDGTER